MRRILEQLSRILQRIAGHAALRRATQWQSIGEPESTAVLAHCDAIVNGLQGGRRRPDGARGSS